MKIALLVLALALGLLLAIVDSSPNWDDTGVTVLAVALCCGALGAASPERPWLWALVLGAWIPIFNVARSGNYGALLALVVAFVGAYAGAGLRRALATAPNR